MSEKSNNTFYFVGGLSLAGLIIVLLIMIPYINPDKTKAQETKQEETEQEVEYYTYKEVPHTNYWILRVHKPLKGTIESSLAKGLTELEETIREIGQNLSRNLRTGRVIPVNSGHERTATDRTFVVEIIEKKPSAESPKSPEPTEPTKLPLW